MDENQAGNSLLQGYLHGPYDGMMNSYLEQLESEVARVEDWFRLPVDPLVSVWLITYNHGQTIRAALDGILNQNVDFPYEVVIGEDCSLDETRDIVKEYQRRYPHIIRLRLARRNLYSRKIKPGHGVFNVCRGRYVAMCEGDDYWTDPLKLQKQVEWLEAHPKASLCFHSCQVERASVPGEPQPEEAGAFFSPITPYIFPDSRALVMWCIIRTVSVVLRRNLLPIFNQKWGALTASDWPIYFYLGMQGPYGWLSDNMAVYRVHDGGVWSRHSIREQKQIIVQTYRFLRKMGGSAYPDEFRAADVNHLRDYMDDLHFIGEGGAPLRNVLQEGIEEIQSPYYSKGRLSRLALEALYYKMQNAGRKNTSQSVLAELVRQHPMVLLNRHWLRCWLER